MKVCIKHRQITNTGECQSGAPPALHAALRNSPVERSARSEAAQRVQEEARRRTAPRKKKREEASTCAPESQRLGLFPQLLLCLACQMNLFLHNFQKNGCLMIIWVHWRSWSGGRLRHRPWRPETSRRAAKPFLTGLPSRAFLTFRTHRFLTSWSRTTARTGSNQVG